jgi:hypothetical protein
MIDRGLPFLFRKFTALWIIPLLLGFSIPMSSAAFADYWPGWRGGGSGVSLETEPSAHLEPDRKPALGCSYTR